MKHGFILHILSYIFTRKFYLGNPGLMGGSLGEFFPRHRLGCRRTWRLVLGGAVHVNVIRQTTGSTKA